MRIRNYCVGCLDNEEDEEEETESGGRGDGEELQLTIENGQWEEKYRVQCRERFLNRSESHSIFR